MIVAVFFVVVWIRNGRGQIKSVLMKFKLMRLKPITVYVSNGQYLLANDTQLSLIRSPSRYAYCQMHLFHHCSKIRSMFLQQRPA